MAGYEVINGRSDLTDVLLPDQVVNDIIQELPKSSVIASRARRVQLSAKKAKQPVLATLPEAYWIDGDTGLMQTTKSAWDNVVITAEDLGVIVPIPNNILDDAGVPLWSEVKPLLSEAVGKKVDGAAMFGDDKPESWPEAIVPAAIAKGNVVTRGTGKDLGVDVAMLGQKLASQGFGINGFASKPGMQWELVGLRNEQGDPIYTQTLAGTPASGLYGYPLNEVQNGSWNTEMADLLAGDWTKFVYGVRQDITFSLYREGVISDSNGKVVLNLMQQRCSALMVTARVGFQVANPLTRLIEGYPAGVIVPSGDAVVPAETPFDPEGDTPPTVDNTNAEIDAWAQAHGIDLSGKTNKPSKIEAITEALASQNG